MADDSLVLDIGGDIGALLIHTGADRAENEIEISPGRPDPGSSRTHNVVHARHSRHGATTYSAVFPQLASGDYTVWRDRATPHGTVTIHGGQITEYRLT
jgi:hypothetical protein